MLKVSISVVADAMTADMLVDWVENQELCTIELYTEKVVGGEQPDGFCNVRITCAPFWADGSGRGDGTVAAQVAEHHRFTEFCGALLGVVQTYMEG